MALLVIGLAMLVGFAMATLGVALLFFGEVPLQGKRIPAGRARLTGIVLLSYLPLAVGVHLLIRSYLGEDVVYGPVVILALFVGCWSCVFLILFRVLVPKKQPRPTTAKAGAKPAKQASNPKPRKPAAGKNEPFDFAG